MPSAWELDLGTARFTLTLSPEKHRGFSGEGALLGLLADPDAAADADLISVLLAWDPRIDIGRLSAGAQISAERTGLALSYLAATGRVGYDLAEESFFHRELPFGPALEAMHPRLAGARALISSGSVVAGQSGADRPPSPYPGSSSRLRFICPHKHMIVWRLRSRHTIPRVLPGQAAIGGCRTRLAPS